MRRQESCMGKGKDCGGKTAFHEAEVGGRQGGGRHRGGSEPFWTSPANTERTYAPTMSSNGYTGKSATAPA